MSRKSLHRQQHQQQQQQQPHTLAPVRPVGVVDFAPRHPVSRDFREVDVPTVDKQGTRVLLPRRFVPCLVRPGMVVRLCDQASETGIVTHVFEDLCVVRGDRGEQIPLRYGDVEVFGCQPDPAWLVPTVLDERPTTVRRRRRPAARPARPRPAAEVKSAVAPPPPHTPRFSLAPEL